MYAHGFKGDKGVAYPENDGNANAEPKQRKA